MLPSKTPTNEVKDAKPKASSSYLMNNYSNIRRRFVQSEQSPGPVQPPIANSHGFFMGGTGSQGGGNGGGSRGDYLQGRMGGLDTLFYSSMQGIVDDPDYAIRKDSRVYERMMRDPQIYYCLKVRKTATASLPWTIKPAVGFEKDAAANKAASEAQDRLKQIPRFSELLDNMLDALLPGMSVNELVWKVNEHGQYIIAKHYPLNKDRFKFDTQGNLRLLTRSAAVKGIPLPPHKFIHHTFDLADGSWSRPEEAGYVYYGRGLADTPLYHYFHFKVTVLKFMLTALERYAIPSKVLFVPPQNNEIARQLHAIMLAMKNDSVITIPGSKDDIDLQELGQSGSSARAHQLFMTFIEYVDKLITRTILGQELMTEIGSTGSYAAAQIHKSVFQWFAKEDQILVQDTLNRTLMVADASLNTPNLPLERRPLFAFKEGALEDTGVFLGGVQAAINLGLSVSETQVREVTGLREPLEGEGVIGGPEYLAQKAQMNAFGGQPGQADQPSQSGADPKAAMNKGQAKTKDKKNDSAKGNQKVPNGEG